MRDNGDGLTGEISRSLKAKQSSVELHALIEKAERRREAIRARHATVSDQSQLARSAPEDVISAAQERERLEAEDLLLRAQLKELRLLEQKALDEEVPAKVRGQLKALTRILDRFERANADAEQARSELKDLVGSMQQTRGRFSYAERRKLAAVSDDDFGRLQAALFVLTPNMGTPQGLGQASAKARLALCHLSDVEEGWLATNEFAARHVRALLEEAGWAPRAE